MPKATATLRDLFVAIVLAGALPAPGFAQPTIRAEVQHASVTPYDVDEPNVLEMAGFDLSLDLRISNTSDKPVYLPKSFSGESGTTRIVLMAMQSRQPDGTWTYLFQGSWYGVGQQKNEACTTLQPGEKTDTGNMPLKFELLSKQAADLGHEPTLRLFIWTFCQKPDGEGHITNLKTDGFALRLPAKP